MTDDPITRIEAALEANPTPGPWYLRTNRHPATNGRPWGWLDPLPPGAGQGYIAGVKVTWERGDRSEANAAYIAACNPVAIRTLLDRFKKAEQRAEHWKAEHLAGNAEVERLREALEAVVAYRTGGLIEGLCRAALENTDAR